MESWQRQFIRHLFPYSASHLQIEQAFLVKHLHIPSLLYKYRDFTDTHLDALKRGVLYMSSPNRFNDPFDTTVYFDPSRFIVEDLPAHELIKRAKTRDELFGSQETWHPEPIKNPIRQSDWLRKIMADVLRDEPLEMRDALETFLADLNDQKYREMRQKMSNWLRSGFSVLSLSDDPTSILMWSHYSNSHQGFCIEYDFGSLPPTDLRRRMCFPVLYRGKRTDATRYMANTGATDFNNLFGQYLCLLKDTSWSYEKEWRIVHTIGADYANREIHMPRPSAIIVGSAAKSDDVEVMKVYCAATGIALKRAVQSDSTAQIIIAEK